MTDDAPDGHAFGNAHMNWEHFSNQSVDLLSTLDTEGYFQWLSPRWTHALGWTLDELKSRPYTHLLHPDDVERSRAEVRMFDRDGGYVAAEFINRYRHKDGHYVWLEWNASRGPDRLLYSTTRVVTRRVEHEQAQREQLALLEAIEAQTSIGRWRVDLVTGAVRWSSSVFHIYGLDADPDAPGAPSVASGIEGYHPDDRAMVSEAVDGAIERGEPFAFVARVVRPSGEVRWVSVDGLVLHDDRNEPTVMHGLIRDITRERSENRQLVHTERLASIGQMAGGVAHEINNPLQFMTLSMELLHDQLVVDVDANALELELLDAAREGADRVRKTVGALRRFVRLPSEQRTLVAPAALLEEALGLTRALLDRDTLLRIEIEDGLPHVEVVEQEIVQSILNVLTNAAQSVASTGRRGSVFVRVFVQKSGPRPQVVFEVEDDGAGLPDDHVSRLFEPFFTTRQSEGGTGLGLSIARGLVAAHGGEVILLDREDGDGAIARLQLPAASAPATHRRPREELDAQADVTRPGVHEVREAVKILLVDDEQTILRALSRHLNAHGYDVTTATDGVEAFQAMKTRDDWALVLCDLKMPTLGGMQLHERVREELPALEPLLHFMTGDSWSPEYKSFLESIARPHLDKPFTLEGLRAFLGANLRAAPSPSQRPVERGSEPL